MVVALEEPGQLSGAADRRVDRASSLAAGFAARVRLDTDHLFTRIGQALSELTEEAGFLFRHVLGVGVERRDDRQRQERGERSLSCVLHRKPLQYRPFGVFANMANAAQDWKRQTWGSIHPSLVFMPAPLPPAYTFGRRLREARLARGMNQAALGAVLGLEEQNSAAPRISRYERGDRMPDNESMAKLAEALELPVAYFHAASDLMAEAILVLSQLPPAKQEELLRHMREFAGASEKASFAVSKAKK